MFNWIKSPWHYFLRHTPGHQWYVTARNTFEGAIGHASAERDAGKVTDRLTSLATIELGQRPWLGLRTKLYGMAEALLMATNFWQAVADEWRSRAEEEKAAKLALMNHCVKLGIPVLLEHLGPPGLKSLEATGIRTWQSLIAATEDQDSPPPLFEQALAALEANPPGEPPPAIVAEYHTLHTWLGSHGVEGNLWALTRGRRSHATTDQRTVATSG